MVNGKFLTILDLNKYVEGGRRAAFEHRLLRTTTAGFLIRQGYRFDAAQQIG